MRGCFVCALLATVLLTAPTQARNMWSERAVSATLVGSARSLYVITSPIWLTSAGYMSLIGASSGSGGGGNIAGRAGPLPPLTVAKVDTLADGVIEVALKNPDLPEDLAVVQWPVRDDNPAKDLKVGDVLDFTPTEVGAGWTVANARGEMLAFMPTQDAAKHHMSEVY